MDGDCAGWWGTGALQLPLTSPDRLSRPTERWRHLFFRFDFWKHPQTQDGADFKQHFKKLLWVGGEGKIVINDLLRWDLFSIKVVCIRSRAWTGPFLTFSLNDYIHFLLFSDFLRFTDSEMKDDAIVFPVWGTHGETNILQARLKHMEAPLGPWALFSACVSSLFITSVTLNEQIHAPAALQHNM